MGISPEERSRIYEEEKARREADGKDNDSPTLKPNVAGLLCYLGIWVTGIIFLITRKNRSIRFHAMQSLVTFGILHIIVAIANMVRSAALWQAGPGWNWFFSPQATAAHAVSTAVTIIMVVLWIVLMYQTYHGRLIKLAVFGELADHLLTKLDGATEATPIEPETPPIPETPPAKQPACAPHDTGRRAGNLAASIGAIVWSGILLVFFNFFSEYFAVYSRSSVDGLAAWQRYPLFTPEFSLVLPILNVTLILTIVGHAIILGLKHYLSRQIILIALSFLGMATTLTFLRVFPFDFSVAPHAGAAAALPTVAVVILILIAIGLGISALVRLVRLIIRVSRNNDEPKPGAN